MHRTPRLLAGPVAAALVVAALTGCSGGVGTIGGCTPGATAGQASDSVQATGRIGQAPTVTFGAPVTVDRTEVSTLIPGSGAPITPQQEIVAEFTILNAATGAVVGRSDYAGSATAARFVVGRISSKGISLALRCAQAGERLAIVMPAAQAFAATSRPTALKATDAVVAVIDVRQAYLARADGADQVMGTGLPAVVLGPDGRPGITLPEGNPPTTSTVVNLKVGSGEVLKRGDSAVVQYTGVVWKPGDAQTGTVFGSSWTGDAPLTWQLAAGQLPAGLLKALVGQKVGSQVLAVLPPSAQTGGQAASGAPASSTLVYVIDVLGKV